MEQLATDASMGLSNNLDDPPRPQFTRQTLLRQIIDFVVADDQVWLNISETYPAYLLPA
jgi:hypothetical protein